MNPLRRWEASVRQIDKFYADRAEQETIVPKLIELVEAWESSGFKLETYKPVRDWVMHWYAMWDLNSEATLAFDLKYKYLKPHIIRCQKALKKKGNR